MRDRNNGKLNNFLFYFLFKIFLMGKFEIYFDKRCGVHFYVKLANNNQNGSSSGNILAIFICGI